MRVCSIIGRNYLAHARVLTDSLRAVHGGCEVVVLLVDDPGRELGAGEPFEVLRPDELGLDPGELDRFALLYPLKGLAACLTPALIARLVRERGDAVLFLDPDMVVHDSLEELPAKALEHGAVVTPHSRAPLAGADGHEAEVLFLTAGVFNGGCLAFGPRGLPFLNWWAERVARDWVFAPAQGFHFSQPYLTLGAMLFEAHVHRDPGVNVMGWNLQSRDVSRTAGRWEIEGVPLRLFHFVGGFDPAQPGKLATTSATVSWPDLAHRPGVAALCEDYSRRLLAAGWEAGGGSYCFDTLPDGVQVDERIRWLYREALLAAEQHGGHPPPLPFSGTSGAFTRWLNAAPPEHHWYSPGVSRYLLTVRGAQADLVARFPGVPGPDNAEYLAWVRGAPHEVTRVPPALLDPVADDAQWPRVRSIRKASI